MSRTDWRSPGAYEELRSLDAPGFAWEFLDRNPDFTRQRRKLERAVRRGFLDPVEVEAFTRRWGLRFRGCCRDERPQLGSLGAACAPKRDRFDEASG